VSQKLAFILLPGKEVFGQEQALITLGMVLSAHGVACRFLTHASIGAAIAERLHDAGLPCSPLPLGSIWSLRLALREPIRIVNNILGTVRSSWEFARLLRVHRPTELITGNASFTAFILPALVASRTRVIYRHGDDLPSHSAFHRALNWLVMRRSDAHVANCLYLKRRITDKYPGVGMDVIYNLPSFLAVATPAPSDPSAGKGTDFNLLYVGQVGAHKGIYELMKAFEMLQAKHPSISLTIVGNVPWGDEVMQADLDAFCARFARVRYMGRQEEVGPFYAAADVHVCPSVYQEPSANVILEAKFHAVPTVVYKVGGLPELIEHQEDGYICDTIDAQSLATGLEYFVADPARCREAGAAARRNLDRRFGRDRYVREWLALIGPAQCQRVS
jgi:glycosyltransferase involved in cell wall biosynthesis